MSVNEKMTALADAIREKSGVTGKLTIDGMTSAVKAISSLIVASASGNPIVLNDSTDLRVQSLRLFGKTTQNGTPAPEAPVPLVSAGDGGSLGVTVAGKNLLKTYSEPKYRGITVDAMADGGFHIYGTATTDCYTGMSVEGIAEFSLPNGTYTVSLREPIDFRCDLWDGDRGDSNAIRLTAGSVSNTRTIVAGNRFRFMATIPGNKTVDFVVYPQLEVGSTATAYEPYKELQTMNLSTPNGLPGIPVTSGGNYTDETGQQWVCDEVDFGRGVYMKRIFGTVFKNAAEWRIAGTKNGLKRFYTNQFMGVIKNAKDDATKECALCSHFINVTASDTWNEVTGISVNSKGRLDIYYSGIEQTTAALEVYFSSNPVAFMAELATPIETPLSAEELAAYAALHTNYPNTTILNDGGAGMEVKYVADTKNYIDNQIAAVAAAIVNA